MGIDAFIIYDTEPRSFAQSFLASSEFTLEHLRQIKQDLRLRGASGSKAELAQTIISAEGISLEVIARRVVTYLPLRHREWMTLKVGRVPSVPTLRNMAELVLSPGQEDWYGPLSVNDDANAFWYVRPVFVPHWELDTQGNPHKYQIRWLCWARLASDHLSLHWNNFTYGDTIAHAGGANGPQRTVQYPYWLQIPHLLDSFTELLNTQMVYINLQQITLHRLWDQYLGQRGYQWMHRRIRAEAGGVSLSAYAGRAVVEMGTGGIEHLAKTIRQAVQDELITVYDTHLPEPERIDEVILRTLIREYGTLSYEFNLVGSQPIISAHVYFGTKKNSQLQDSFPHVRLTDSKITDLAQLKFLLDHQ